MTFKKGDLILVTEIHSILRYSEDMPQIGGIYLVEEEMTSQHIKIVTSDNKALVSGIRPTGLTEELV